LLHTRKKKNKNRKGNDAGGSDVIGLCCECKERKEKKNFRHFVADGAGFSRLNPNANFEFSFQPTTQKIASYRRLMNGRRGTFMSNNIV
jgi:hypothetical protein